MFKRSIHNTSRILNHIRTKDDINKLLSNPTWSINELLTSSKSSTSHEITYETVAKIIKLSGLNDKVTPKLIDSLKLQMNFIQKLYEHDDRELNKTEDSNDCLFRLTDAYKEIKPMTLEQLQFEISNLTPDKSKGE